MLPADNKKLSENMFSAENMILSANMLSSDYTHTLTASRWNTKEYTMKHFWSHLLFIN
jgi:hypothetical protein